MPLSLTNKESERKKEKKKKKEHLKKDWMKRRGINSRHFTKDLKTLHHRFDSASHKTYIITWNERKMP